MTDTAATRQVTTDHGTRDEFFARFEAKRLAFEYEDDGRFFRSLSAPAPAGADPRP